MNDFAIKVEGISKKYFIGGRAINKSLRDTITDFVNSISKIYNKKNSFSEQGTFWALKDISFDVKWGEVLGIIGSNGSGKSTLFKILSRITEPTEGQAKIYGRTGSLLEVGTGFHQELTGRENVYFNGSVLGMKKHEIDNRFDEIVAFSGVEKFIDTPVKRYSSGMYVRLAFSVAAHLRPEIMIVDEVLAVGDIDFQKKCIDRMKEISNLGKTVLVVSHSMSTVKSLCTRAIMLDKGKIKFLGPVDEVVNKYIGHNKADTMEKIIKNEDYMIKSDRMYIKKVRLLNGVENKFAVHWCQPIDVLLELEVCEISKEISFGAGIKKDDDTVIFTVHHDDYNKHLKWKFDPGHYNIKFTLSNDLKPGVYKLCIGAHYENHRNVLFYTEAINIEILEYNENGNGPLIYNPGLINGNIQWQEPVFLM